MIIENSLSETLNQVNAALLLGREISPSARKKTALWLAGRQGLPGAYGGTFALFPEECRMGIRVLTGERMTCASARHIAGEETCRVLRLLQVEIPEVSAALERADESMRNLMNSASGNIGWYCCGKCSVSVWRNLTAGNLNRCDDRLKNGMKLLRQRRVPDGQWQGMPFYYTLSALVEIAIPSAKAEIKHAAGRVKSLLRRNNGSDATTVCRRAVLEKALSVV